eukprot:745704-Amphidinium_carterae.1
MSVSTPPLQLCQLITSLCDAALKFCNVQGLILMDRTGVENVVIIDQLSYEEIDVHLHRRFQPNGVRQRPGTTNSHRMLPKIFKQTARNLARAGKNIPVKGAYVNLQHGVQALWRHHAGYA